MSVTGDTMLWLNTNTAIYIAPVARTGYWFAIWNGEEWSKVKEDGEQL
jgi:hypothetical protein